MHATTWRSSTAAVHVDWLLFTNNFFFCSTLFNSLLHYYINTQTKDVAFLTAVPIKNNEKWSESRLCRYYPVQVPIPDEIFLLIHKKYFTFKGFALVSPFVVRLKTNWLQFMHTYTRNTHINYHYLRQLYIFFISVKKHKSYKVLYMKQMKSHKTREQHWD